MEYVTFYIGERPQVYWDWDLASKNLEFLKGVDGSFFTHVVAVQEPHLDGDSKLHAAASLRLAYAQALETFFALACATMQAPECVIGWMLSYNNSELDKMVASVSSLSARPHVRPEYAPASWKGLARIVHAGITCDDDQRAWIQQGFGTAWTRFAREFADECNSQEYNALKHGIRPRLGGFYLSFGEEAAPGVAPSSESMHCMGGSDFGSTFFVAERLGSGALHRRPKSVSVNWVPENMVEGISLLALSIQNLVSYLRLINGDAVKDCAFAAPSAEAAFDLPWAKSCGVTSTSMDRKLEASDVELWTRAEVLETLGHPQPPSG